MGTNVPHVDRIVVAIASLSMTRHVEPEQHLQRSTASENGTSGQGTSYGT